MDFYVVLDQIVALLQGRRPVAYWALRVQFNLVDEGLQALNAELIEAHPIAVDRGHLTGVDGRRRSTAGATAPALAIYTIASNRRGSSAPATSGAEGACSRTPSAHGAVL
jgi:hypothetical protein